MHRTAVTSIHRALSALAAVFIAGAPTTLAAQAVLLGTVRSDSLNAPLSHAEVAIPSLKIGSYTDSSGHFRIERIKPGEYDVVIRQFGYVPRVVRLTFDQNEVTAQQFELTPSPTILAKVKVTAPDTARSLYVDNIAGFEGRRARGFGSFITAQELHAAREHDMTTVLHTIPQVRFYRINTGAMVAGSEESGRRCYAQVYLDGVKVLNAFDVNTIRPGTLRGIEFYPTFNAPSDYSAGPGYCGVLIFWTKVRNN